MTDVTAHSNLSCPKGKHFETILRVLVHMGKKVV